jgi:sugar phosphate isomerase/epimerase
VGQARKVQVGYCSTLKNIDAAKAAGFDYVELGTTEIAALSDDDEYDYAPFFASLREIGFDKRISVEASAKDFPSEAPQAIALLRRAFER